MDINNREISYLYESIKDMMYSRFDEEDTYLNKENIYYKQNKEKLNLEIIEHKNEFLDLIEKRYNYKLNFSDEDIIILDILIKDPIESDLIDGNEEEKIIKWVNYLGAYFLYYIKKNTKINHKIKYPIYNSYFKKDNERIYPFLIAAKKISIDSFFENYTFFGELLSYCLNEDFKPDLQYVEEIKTKNRKVILKSYIRTKN